MLFQIRGALGQRLGMGNHRLDIRKCRTGQCQQIVADSQFIHAVDVQAAVKHHIGDLPHFPCRAVFQRQDGTAAVPLQHRLVSGGKIGIAHQCGVGEDLPCRDVGKSTLHTAVGHPHTLQQLALIILGNIHVILQKAHVMLPELGIGHPCRALFQNLFFPCTVKDGQTPLFFIFRHLYGGFHTTHEQCSHLLVHLRDDLAGFLQLIHGFCSFSTIKSKTKRLPPVRQ